MPIKRSVAALLAAVMAANGLAMLFAGPWWYGVVPGVTATGPFNAHFIKDIGAAFLMAGVGLGWFAWRPASGRPTALMAAGFLVAHALIHVADAAGGHHPGHDVLRDLAGVYLPAVLSAWIAWPNSRST